jgi:predicted nucleic acid-binding protein
VNFFYLDASALAKRFVPEKGTPLVNHVFSQVSLDRLYLLNIGIAEVVSLLVRKKNAGHVTESALSQALIDFGNEIVYALLIRKIVADHRLVTDALPFIRLHSINATDGIILCSALKEAASLRTSADDLVLVSSDQRLLKATQAEGLQTFDPETQTQAELTALLAP